MQPRDFKQATGKLARPADMKDEECGSLPVYQGKMESGPERSRPYRYCLSCWRMGWWERTKALFHGRVWVWVISNSHTQPPIALSAQRNPFGKGKANEQAT